MTIDYRETCPSCMARLARTKIVEAESYAADSCDIAAQDIRRGCSRQAARWQINQTIEALRALLKAWEPTDEGP